LGSEKIFLTLQNDLCNGAVPPNGRTAVNLFGDPLLSLAKVHRVFDLLHECTQPFSLLLGRPCKIPVLVSAVLFPG